MRLRRKRFLNRHVLPLKPKTPKVVKLENIIAFSVGALTAATMLKSKNPVVGKVLDALGIPEATSSEPFPHKCHPLPLIHRCPSCGEYVKAE